MLHPAIEKGKKERAAIQRFRNQISQSRGRKIFRINPNELLKYAAIIILAIALPASYYLGTRRADRQSMTTISCAFGDKSMVILPDNSKVWLNSGSKLMFNSDFEHAGREVLPEGGAYFNITKDKHHPFGVKASDINIEVLQHL